MGPRRSEGSQLRLRVAHEAARLIAEGLADIGHARRKAAAKLGVREDASLPSGDEIRAALREHQRLFAGEGPPANVPRLRAAALDAMAFFAAFQPRLVGPVLDGSADARSVVCLQLHSDDSESLLHLLRDQRIPAQQRQRRVMLERGRPHECPTWEFQADGIAFELVLLPAASLRQPPWDALDDRPMDRAGAPALEALLRTGVTPTPK